MTLGVKQISNGRYEKLGPILMGRRRAFDADTVLDAAMCVFWRKGYEGASYADLTEAAGVERPALYAAFGNKEALFRQALTRYAERFFDHIPQAFEMPTAREAVAHFLQRSVELNTRSADHLGCLGVNGALAGSDDSEAVRQALMEFRAAGLELFRERFERAKAEGDLAEDADPRILATYLMAVAHGIAVQAKAGFPRETLQAVAAQAIANWPGSGGR